MKLRFQQFSGPQKVDNVVNEFVLVSNMDKRLLVRAATQYTQLTLTVSVALLQLLVSWLKNFIELQSVQFLTDFED